MNMDMRHTVFVVYSNFYVVWIINNGLFSNKCEWKVHLQIFGRHSILACTSQHCYNGQQLRRFFHLHTVEQEAFVAAVGFGGSGGTDVFLLYCMSRMYISYFLEIMHHLTFWKSIVAENVNNVASINKINLEIKQISPYDMTWELVLN